MLTVSSIYKDFKDKKVLNNISFNVEKGNVVSLIGDNGSGKTTLFKIIADLLEKDYGGVLLDWEETDYHNFSYLLEERSLFLDCSCLEQLNLIAKMNKIINPSEKIKKIVDFLKIDESLLKKKISTLSKGNKQKIALAVCLLKECEVYILDEPFTGLDHDNIDILIKVIKSLKYHNKIVLLSSHIYQPISEITDKYLYLQKGKIKLDVDVQQLKKSGKWVVETNSNKLYEETYIENFYQRNNNTYYICDSKENGIKLTRKILNNKTSVNLREIQFEDIFYLSKDTITI